MRHLRRRPLYSACNEDTRSELLALAVRSDDSVVGIASGGGRVLSLLAAGPRRLIALDRSLEQIYALELKAAAMDALDYSAFRAFLGVDGQAEPLDFYVGIRASLTPGARSFWDHRLDQIASGVLYGGRAELTVSRLFRWLRRAGPLGWIDEAFELDGVEEQRMFFKEKPDRLAGLERALRLYCHPAVVFSLTQDHSFLGSSKAGNGRYMARCLDSWLQSHVARESFVLRLFCFGRYAPDGPLPPFLTREGFQRARECLPRLEIRHIPLEDFAFRPRLEGRVKWSISDVGAWMSERAYHDLLRSICLHGEAGSRFCSRGFVATRALPRDLLRYARRLDRICADLEQRDSSVFWSFDVCEYGT